MQFPHRNPQIPLPNTTVCAGFGPDKRESGDDDEVVERSIDKGTDQNSKNQKARYKD